MMSYRTSQKPRRTTRRPSPPTPLVVIQVIRSVWGKAFRGGEGARVRNQVPEALELPLPTDRIVVPSYLVHSSQSSFPGIPATSRSPRETLRVRPATEPLTCGCLHARLEDGKLSVDYQWTVAAGMPARYPRRDVLVVSPGQWGRIRYNERHSPSYTFNCWGEGEWWYEKWVFNIGLFTTLSSRPFLDTMPAKVYSAMDHLW
jgi:hypothetical protein